MADVLTKAQRSYVMSRIRGKDTKPELVARKYLFARGLRYRKHDKRFPGRPDMYFAKWRAAVFVNGCFWHAHQGCPGFRMPQSRKAYWRKKLNGNRRRDKKNQAELAAMGLRVIVVWECELKKPVREKRLKKLYKEITGGKAAAKKSKAAEQGKPKPTPRPRGRTLKKVRRNNTEPRGRKHGTSNA